AVYVRDDHRGEPGHGVQPVHDRLRTEPIAAGPRTARHRLRADGRHGGPPRGGGARDRLRWVRGVPAIPHPARNGGARDRIVVAMGLASAIREFLYGMTGYEFARQANELRHE